MCQNVARNVFLLSKRQLNFCDFNLQSRKTKLHILALLCKKSLTDDSVFGPFYSKIAWSTDHKVCGRPTIGCLHDRPQGVWSTDQSTYGRPTREKFSDYLDNSWSFWVIFDLAQIRAMSTSVDFERFQEHLENSDSKQKDAKCEQCVNVGQDRPLHHKASMYSMCQDINLSSVPSVGHKTGSSYHHGLDGQDGFAIGGKRSKSLLLSLGLRPCSQVVMFIHASKLA